MPAPDSIDAVGVSAERCRLASLFACFRARRSRTAFSRSRFAIVVFRLAPDAIRSSLRSCAGVGRLLEGLYVRRVRALGATLGVVAHLRALGQRPVAVAADRAVMHEQILALIVRGDEAEALLVTEPLDGSGSHCSSRGGHVRRNAGDAMATTTER